MDIRGIKNIMSNIRTRILSSILLAPLFITSILLSPKLFITVISIIAILMLLEWYDMAKSITMQLLIGLPIIILPTICLIHLRLLESGASLTLLYFLMLWSVDIFAMLGGKKIGGARLAPVISPKKTWSGLCCGIFGCIATLLITKAVMTTFPLSLGWMKLIGLGLCFGVMEQCSDLFISSFKRRFNIKDSGMIIPGHGGMLDRFDGIIFTAPMFLWIAL